MTDKQTNRQTDKQTNRHIHEPVYRFAPQITMNQGSTLSGENNTLVITMTVTNTMTLTVTMTMNITTTTTMTMTMTMFFTKLVQTICFICFYKCYISS